MKTTITQYRSLATDARGFSMPVGDVRLGSTGLTAAGAIPALGMDTNFVRIATDTAIQISMGAAPPDVNSEMMPANTVEFFKVSGGQVVNVQLA